jgi:nucleoid DNA-binding protein
LKLEDRVIKLDIVNAIVTKTNVTRTKAEQAVETVFEAMKNALGRGERIELRRFGVFNVKPRKTGIARGNRLASLPARPCVSSPAKNFRRSQRHLRHLPPSRERALLNGRP